MTGKTYAVRRTHRLVLLLARELPPTTSASPSSSKPGGHVLREEACSDRVDAVILADHVGDEGRQAI